MDTISEQDKKDFIAWKKFFCKEKIAAYEDALTVARSKLDKFCQVLITCQNENEEILVNAHITLVKLEIEKIEHTIKRWQFKYRIVAGLVKEGERNLEYIKNIPIGSLFSPSERKNRVMHNKQFFSCPKHEDKTPSLCWYIKDNRAYCFSCQGSFDVVDVMMAKEKCDFKTALNLLS